jgi:WD40 repeat protein
MRWLPLVVLFTLPAGATAQPDPVPREVRLNQDGDPLPTAAVARLGSARFRVPAPVRVSYAADRDTALAFDGKGITTWDLRTGVARSTWRLAGANEVVLSPDGRWAVFREAGTVRVWDVRENRPPIRLSGGETGPLGAAAFAADGRHVALVDEWEGASRLRVWDLATGRVRLAASREGPAGGLWFVDGGRRLLSHPSDQHDVTCWDVATGKRAWQLDLRARIVACSEGPYFVVESQHRGFALHAVADGQPVPCRGLAALESGWQQILASSADGSRIVWSDRRENGLFVGRVAPGDEELKPVRIDAAPGEDPRVALSTDGRRLLVAHSRLTEYDTATGRRLTPAPPEWALADRLEDPVWTRDGRRVLAQPVILAEQGRPGPAKDRFLWAADTGRFLKRVSQAQINGHHPDRHRPFLRVEEEALSDWTYADPPAAGESGSFLNGTLLSGDRRFGIRVGPRRRSELPWRPIEAPFERTTLRELKLSSVDLASTVAFSPAGRTLAVVQPNGLRLWDLWTGRAGRTFLAAPAGASDASLPLGHSLAFSPDGGRLAMGAADGTILIWDTSRPAGPAEPLKEAVLDRLWADLAAADAVVAWAAAARLADRPPEAMPLLARRLTPVVALTEAETRRLLAELDAPAYRTREQAMKRVADLGDAGKAMVETALKGKTGAEVRQRLEALSAALEWKHAPGSEDLRRLRALAVLEQIGTKDARAKVGEMAGGLPSARVTLEANQVRRRLADRDQVDKD